MPLVRSKATGHTYMPRSATGQGALPFNFTADEHLDVAMLETWL